MFKDYLIDKLRELQELLEYQVKLPYEVVIPATDELYNNLYPWMTATFENNTYFYTYFFNKKDKQSYVICRFKKEEDALAFKLQWC